MVKTRGAPRQTGRFPACNKGGYYHHPPQPHVTISVCLPIIVGGLISVQEAGVQAIYQEVDVASLRSRLE